MDGLFLYIILIAGFTLVCASIMWFTMDLRKTKSLLQKAEAEKNELRSIISDAEMMVEELNSFSGYLLEKIDKKNSEAGLFLDKLDESMRSAALTADNVDTGDDAEDSDDEDTGEDEYADATADSIAGVNIDANEDIAAGANTSEYADITADANTSAYAHTAADANTSAYANTAADAFIDVYAAADAFIGAYAGGDDFGDERGLLSDSENCSPLIAGGRASLPGRRYKSRAIRRYIGKNADNPEISTGIPDLHDDLARDVPDVVAVSDADNVTPASPLIILPDYVRREHSVQPNERYKAILSHNHKYIEVMQGYKEGMDETEIAKTLNIGRGEVALILGLREGGAV